LTCANAGDGSSGSDAPVVSGELVRVRKTGGEAVVLIGQRGGEDVGIDHLVRDGFAVLDRLGVGQPRVHHRQRELVIRADVGAAAPQRPQHDRLGDVGGDRVATGGGLAAGLGEGELAVLGPGRAGAQDAGGAGRQRVGDGRETQVQQHPVAAPVVLVVGGEGDVGGVAEGAEAGVRVTPRIRWREGVQDRGGDAGGPRDGERGGAAGPLAQAPVDVDPGGQPHQRLAGGAGPLGERAAPRGRFLARQFHDSARQSSLVHVAMFSCPTRGDETATDLIGRTWHITSMSTFRVGLIGLPHIRDAFEQSGVETVSGDTFLETTRTLREAAATSSLPVLVEDQYQTGLAQLLTRLAETGPVTIARRDRHVLGEEWASIPIASPLSDYLRAAGLPDGDIDPALAEVIPDEDGKVSDQLPAAGTTPLALPDPEPGGPSASSGPEPEVADWLSDADETETADRQQTSAPEPSPQDGRPEPSDLADWLSDGDDTPEPESVSVIEPATEVPDDDGEDEDFDGLYEPAPTPETATDHPTEPGPAPVPPSTSSEGVPRHGRRRISLPTFAPHPEPADPAATMSAEQTVDEDLFDDVPAHEVDPDEADE